MADQYVRLVVVDAHGNRSEPSRAVVPQAASSDSSSGPSQSDFDALETRVDSVESVNSSQADSIDDHTDRIGNLEKATADSGWKTLTLNSGIGSGSGLAYRLIGACCYLKGVVTLTTTSSTTAQTLFTLPAGYRPVLEVRSAADVYASTAASGTGVTITTAGVTSAYQYGTAGGKTVRLTGISYLVN